MPRTTRKRRHAKLCAWAIGLAACLSGACVSSGPPVSVHRAMDAEYAEFEPTPRIAARSAGKPVPQRPWDSRLTAPAALSGSGVDGPEAVRLDESADLQDYLAYAALNNPGLEAAFHRWQAAREQRLQVTALPDPRFTYRYFIREVETRVGPQQQSFGLAQTFPWPGKLTLRGDMADEDARTARQAYEQAKLALFYEVKEAYYDYFYLERAIAIVRENVELVKRLEGVARARYKTASTGQSEVIRDQVELGRLEDHLQTLLDQRKPVIARLNAALNRDPQEPLPAPSTVPEQRLAASDEDILRWLAENSPELRALDHQIERWSRAVELAGKDFFPDFTLGVDYTDVGSAASGEPPGLSNPGAVRSVSRLAGGMGDAIDLYSIGRSLRPGDRPDDSGKDIWAVSLSMNIPLWRGKYTAGQREARAKHLSARKARMDLENTLKARAQAILYKYRDAVRKIDLYRDELIPKAREALNATETAFRTGQASFLDLVDAEQTLLDFALSYERARASHGQRLAELEMLVGRTIPQESKSPSPTRKEEKP